MSKEKRQKRFQQKNRHIDRQVKIKKVSLWYKDGDEMQPHRYHKMKAVDCGIPGCRYCGNPRRVWGDKTIQETKFECQAVEQTNRDSIGKQEWEDLNDPAMEW